MRLPPMFSYWRKLDHQRRGGGPLRVRELLGCFLADGTVSERCIHAKAYRLVLRVGFIITNLRYPPKGVTRFYNGRGTAEQWIKEGKNALNWARLSCHRFVANQVRLGLFILAYNLGNFVRRLALPESVKHWSLRSVQTRLIKIGGRLMRRARRLVFQLAEVIMTRDVFSGVLERISKLCPRPG
jgi:hypothetical protein